MDLLLGRLQEARARGVEARIDPADLPATLAGAYAAGLAQAAQVAAWKIGGANPWSRAVFDNTEVFFGPLTPAEVAFDTARLAVAGLHAPLAEPEIMLELADPGNGALEQAFARMGLGFEIPASVLPAPVKTMLTGQIADRAGAGALWVGAVRRFDRELLETPFASVFRHNGGAPVAGGGGNIIGGPLGAVRDFLRLARHYGMPLRNGQWIATGGVNPAVAVAPGDRLEFEALGVGVALDIV